MDITDEIYLATRDDWRAWLEKNHATAPGVWLIYYKKVKIVAEGVNSLGSPDAKTTKLLRALGKKVGEESLKK